MTETKIEGDNFTDEELVELRSELSATEYYVRTPVGKLVARFIRTLFWYKQVTAYRQALRQEDQQAFKKTLEILEDRIVELKNKLAETQASVTWIQKDGTRYVEEIRALKKLEEYLREEWNCVVQADDAKPIFDELKRVRET